MKHFSVFILCLFIFGYPYLSAQSFSNKGTDFWVTYPAHIDGTTSVMGIYITATTNASGSITVNGKIIPFTVTANTVTEKFIGSTVAADASNSYVYLANNGITTGAAIHVVSNDNPVVVYAHIIHSARSGATLLLPSNVWGKQYIVPSYSSTGNSKGEGYGTISIVAANANTSVQITPAATTLDNHLPGTSYTITLANPGDVYQMEFQQNADISGTIIQLYNQFLMGVPARRLQYFPVLPGVHLVALGLAVVITCFSNYFLPVHGGKILQLYQQKPGILIYSESMLQIL